MDALEQPVRPGLGDADQPHAIAERRRLGDVGGEHVADAAGRDVGERRARAERDAGEDRQLVRGIDAVDVEARVGLGKAQRLRLGQHLGEVAALGLHLGQDEIAGAVEDAIDAVDAVGGGAVAQALDHRHAARDRRLELERGARGLGGLGEFEPVMRHHRLVGGDQALAAGQRRARQRQRGAVRPADQLDHDIGVVALGQRARCRLPRRSARYRRRDPWRGRAPTPRRSRSRRPARRAISSRLASSKRITPPPTVPSPASATRRGLVEAIVAALSVSAARFVYVRRASSAIPSASASAARRSTTLDGPGTPEPARQAAKIGSSRRAASLASSDPIGRAHQRQAAYAVAPDDAFADRDPAPHQPGLQRDGAIGRADRGAALELHVDPRLRHGQRREQHPARETATRHDQATHRSLPSVVRAYTMNRSGFHQPDFDQPLVQIIVRGDRGRIMVRVIRGDACWAASRSGIPDWDAGRTASNSARSRGARAAG